MKAKLQKTSASFRKFPRSQQAPPRWPQSRAVKIERHLQSSFVSPFFKFQNCCSRPHQIDQNCDRAACGLGTPVRAGSFGPAAAQNERLPAEYLGKTVQKNAIWRTVLTDKMAAVFSAQRNLRVEERISHV